MSAFDLKLDFTGKEQTKFIPVIFLTFSVFNSISVASVTVWVGRLPRNFNGESLFNHFNEYADVKNIDVSTNNHPQDQGHIQNKIH